MADLTRWIRDRADSYWRDARVLDEDGDHAQAGAYRTVAGELRRLADDLPVWLAEVDGVDDLIGQLDGTGE